MKKYLVVLFMFAVFSMGLSAAPTTYDFKDPKGVNHVIFMLDAPLEFISGTGTGISGLVDFDPEAPEKTKGEIILTAESLQVTNPRMSKVMQKKKWLNAEVHKELRFSFNSVTVKSNQDSIVEGSVTGILSFLGVEKEITAPVKMTWVEDGGKGRGAGTSSLLVVRSEFSITLSDFGMKINAAEQLKVSNEPQIKVVIAGYPQAAE